MQLEVKILNDLVIAMRARDKTRVQVLRMLVSELAYGRTTNPKPELEIIQRYKKKLQDTLSFTPDDSTVMEELEIVNSYIPAEPTEQELSDYIRTIAGESMKDMMGAVKSYFPSAPGKLVSELVKKEIASRNKTA